MSFTNIDNSILDNEDLNIQEQSLLITIISYYNKEKGYAYPSYKQLKIRSKIKKDETLIKTLNSLINKGILSKKTEVGKGNKYFLLPTPKMEYPQKWSTPKNGVPPTPKTEYHPLQKRSTTNTNINTKTNIYISNDEKQQNLTNRLWLMYPNKKDKAKAFIHIKNLLRQYNFEELKRCVERYTNEVKGREQKFIKNSGAFFESKYMDYLDENFKEIIKESKIKKYDLSDMIQI